MSTANLSLYANATTPVSYEVMEVEQFFDNIRSGYWQDIVIPLRALQGEARDAAKKKAPCVTLAGTFLQRRDDALIEHSGLIAIDIDDLKDPEEFKHKLKSDPYVYAAFVSIGGKGLCVVFKINPARHRDAFRGISEYFFNYYKVVVDPTSINVSRLRFVSYDPDLYLNEGHVKKFVQYPKDKEPKKVEKVVFVKTDFDEIINQILGDRINLCENYHEWVRIAFAFVDAFGEGGRNYFHQVSSISGKYEPVICDKQYTNCLKHKSSGNRATIATFYYYCKQAGVVTYSERTRKIAHSAFNGKRGGLTAEQVAENLLKFEGIDGPDVLQIVRQVQENDIKIEDGSPIDQIEMFLRQNYELKRNEITRYIENHGAQVNKTELNTIYITCKKVFADVSYDLLDRLIDSNFIPSYNPLTQFFEENADLKPSGNIQKIFNCIRSKDQDYVLHFGTKWLVGMVAAAHGSHNVLNLVLSGEKQRTGKTEWFRRLLPPELKAYYAESRMDAGKDDYILMCQKWLLVDDEMGGRSKKESKLWKALSSKDIFSLREPYGRGNVDLRRLATFGGTTNDDEILVDPTGNRRVIPVKVNAIDHALYNSVDKKELFMEAYHLWKSGFQWELTSEDVTYLNMDSDSFREINLESELFLKYFKPAERESGIGVFEMTASEIKTEIELQTKQRLSLNKLGAEMKRIGVKQIHRRIGLSSMRVYLVERTPIELGHPGFNSTGGLNGWRPIEPPTSIEPSEFF